MHSHFNPKFTSLKIDREMKDMGIDEGRASFFYEKVSGRQEGKSVYRLSRKGPFEDEDFEFDLANGKMYIKNFDCTEMPQKELDIEETLRRFQDIDIFDQESLINKLHVPIKRQEQTESSSSVAKEGLMYSPGMDTAEKFSKYTMNSSSTQQSTQYKPSTDKKPYGIAQTPNYKKKHSQS